MKGRWLEMRGRLSLQNTRHLLQRMVELPSLVPVLCFLVAFLCGLWWAFPEQLVLQRVQQELYRQSGLRLVAEQSEMEFLFGLRYRNARLEPLPHGVALSIDELRVSPDWGGLFSGDPGVEIELSGWGGKLHGIVGSDGRLELAASGFDLAQLKALPGNYRLAGLLSGSVQGRLRPATQLDGKLRVERARLSGLEAFGIEEALSLGRLSAEGTFKGKNLQVETLRLTGGVVDLEGKGTLLVGETPARSRISATLGVTPGEGLPPMFRDLLGMSGQQPDPQGRYTFRLSGRLDAPTLR